MVSEQELIATDIKAYLDKYQKKELLRFVTVGSVDDGKSTLIGRLLHDTESVYMDQLEAVKKSSKNVESDIDLSLITDGLKAEREQGITIDVAYRYFSTEKRKFIIADTPGHIQYTRNMATGASTAHVGIILIDARLGVLGQSRRHAYIASLLGIPHLAVCVNKMDLVDYNQEAYENIKKDFAAFASDLNFQSVTFFPISALVGDNTVSLSDKTPWYQGQTVLDFLETVPIPKHVNHNEFCLPVQYVLRPNLNFRGYAGSLTSGIVKKGDTVVVSASGKKSKVQGIHTYQGEVNEAFAPQSITLTLEDEIDISRSDVLVHEKNVFHSSRKISAHLVWMNETPLDSTRQYWIKQTTTTTTCLIDHIDYLMDVESFEKKDATRLALNEIGKVELHLARPITVAPYQENRQLGAFILIDRLTNITVAAGMIDTYLKDSESDKDVLSHELSTSERADRFLQKPCALWISGRPGSGKLILARALEKRLFKMGHLAYSFDRDRLQHADGHLTENEITSVMDKAKLSLDMGQITILAFTFENQDLFKQAQENIDNQLEIFIDTPVELCQQRLTKLGKDPQNAARDFEAPTHADLKLYGHDFDAHKAADKVIELLFEKKIIK